MTTEVAQPQVQIPGALGLKLAVSPSGRNRLRWRRGECVGEQRRSEYLSRCTVFVMMLCFGNGLTCLPRRKSRERERESLSPKIQLSAFFFLLIIITTKSAAAAARMTLKHYTLWHVHISERGAEPAMLKTFWGSIGKDVCPLLPLLAKVSRSQHLGLFLQVASDRNSIPVVHHCFL